ncbi:MAG TPA: aminotransferase class V-fold PLP-dependent enzyme [Limnochordales bacterium]|nr:aminotransferase class V-fold PLP-dependent enzyme [Limnochordales bacterium]
MRASIPALQEQVYLNTGVSGPPTREILEEELAWVRRLGQQGPGSFGVLTEALDYLDQVRGALARLIGAEPQEIALTHSCSEGLAIVAAGLPWQAGDEVVVTDLEHISGLLPWFHLARQRGIAVRRVPDRDGRLVVDDVRAALTERTRLICMSHVAYNTGAVLPVADVASLARERGIWLLVDGAQGAGQVPVDVKALGCHFYAGAGQKWLLGPDGTGFLYVDQAALDAVAVTWIGWASVVHEDVPAGAFRFHPGARRFEVAGLHVPSFAALGKGADLWHSLGVAAARGRILALVDRLREGLARLPQVEILSPGPEPLRSGLVVFRMAGVDAPVAVEQLWERHRIACRWVPAPRAVRVSVHAFNNEDDIDRLVAAVGELVRAAG